jgi:hypothetical protein
MKLFLIFTFLWAWWLIEIKEFISSNGMQNELAFCLFKISLLSLGMILIVLASFYPNYLQSVIQSLLQPQLPIENNTVVTINKPFKLNGNL